MPNKHLTDEEKELLASAMEDVKPIRAKARLERPLPERKRPKISAKSAPLVPPLPSRGTGAADKQTIGKVKAGEYAPEAKLDLHGLTLEEAYSRLTAFISKQAAKQRRCVLVITGKGGKDGKKGELQREVPRWLALSGMAAQVLVVSQAQPKHGGEGALYVLLRRVRQ